MKKYLVAVLCVVSMSVATRDIPVRTYQHVHPDPLLDINDDEINFLNTLMYKSCTAFGVLHFSYGIARDIILRDIPGDMVECGVAAGVQTAAMAKVCQRYNRMRKIHLFDSFEGIPLAGPCDTAQPGIGYITHDVNVGSEKLLKSSGVSSWSLDAVKNNMREWGIDPIYLKYHVGWFQHTLPTVADSIKEISYLRLDGDLYESTKVCLDYLYPKVVPGGWVLIDDYNALEGCKRAVDEYINEHNLDVDMIEIPYGNHPVYWRVK